MPLVRSIANFIHEEFPVLAKTSIEQEDFFMRTLNSFRSRLAWFVAVLLAFEGRTLAAEKEDVVAFLKKNVIGRKLEHRSTVKMANNTLETEFVRQTIYTNLQETSESFSFDVLFVIKQTIFDLDKEGKRTGPGRHEDRVLASRYELTIRKSTGRLLGSLRGLANSLTNPTGYTSLVRIELKGDRLIITNTNVGYGDYFGKEGRFEPATSDSQTVMELKEGKLYSKETTTSFNVDPETMQRTSKRDEITNVDKEAETK
ncbi:hypothetical protein ACYOEI_22335 [Singulisphaera rosea]